MGVAGVEPHRGSAKRQNPPGIPSGLADNTPSLGGCAHCGLLNL